MVTVAWSCCASASTIPVPRPGLAKAGSRVHPLLRSSTCRGHDSPDERKSTRIRPSSKSCLLESASFGSTNSALAGSALSFFKISIRAATTAPSICGLQAASGHRGRPRFPGVQVLLEQQDRALLPRLQWHRAHIRYSVRLGLTWTRKGPPPPIEIRGDGLRRCLRRGREGEAGTKFCPNAYLAASRSWLVNRSSRRWSAAWLRGEMLPIRS